MKKILALFLSATMGLPAVAIGFVPDVTEIAKGRVKVSVDNVRIQPQSSAVMHSKVSTSATPLFTADVPEALSPSWSENFDNGSLKNWTKDDAKNVTWSVKALSGDKSFDAYDPDNLNSLVVEGPYQVYKREISSLTSNSFTVPCNGSLSAYVGYTLNYDDACRLLISVSTDDFETSTELWNSKDGEGDRPWAWRPVKADLSKWAGQDVKLRLTYSWGSGDETFKTGGYLGDFAVDGLKVSGLAPVPGVSLEAGTKLRLVSLAAGAVSYKWTMNGAVPGVSDAASPVIYYTEPGNYDITLEVKDKNGETSSFTATGYVTVTGTAPVARILPPATFSYVDADLEYPYLVSPLASVTFTDASSGFPTDRTWVFSGLTEDDSSAKVETKDPSPSVNYMYQHKWPVGLTVSNATGSSSDMVTVAAEYQGAITNWKKGDIPATFDMEDWGTFPGSNTHNITRYAERFSAPSRPCVMGGAYLYFVEAPSTVAITDNATITVSVYTSENGLPGKRLDFGLLDVIDLDGPAADGSLRGSWFEFTDLPVVTGDFFIVVDGLPAPHDDFKGVSFAMAAWRPSGNTALLEVDGKWREADEYFGSGKCTSYLVRPVIRHSAIASLPVGEDVITFGKEGGQLTHTIFSYMGRQETVDCDADWCRVISKPGEYTVDDLTIACDPNDTGMDREAHLTISDGVGSHVLTVKQRTSSGVSPAETAFPQVLACPTLFDDSFTLTFPAGSSMLQVIDLNGRLIMSRNIVPDATSMTIDGSNWTKGLYIVLIDDTPVKVGRR